MAEQYQSFQGKEPNIEVDLFIKKAAQEETVRAAKTAELQKGLQLGIQGYEAYSQGQLRGAQTEAIQIQNQEATAAGVPEARRQQELAKGEVAKLEAAVLAQNSELAQATKKAQLEVAYQESSNKLEDLNNKETINSWLSNSIGLGRDEHTAAVNSIFTDPKLMRTLQENPDFANQVIGASRGIADPAIIARAQQSFDAVAIEKNRMEVAKSIEVDKEKRRMKTEDKYEEAVDLMQSEPAVAERLSDPTLDYTKIKSFDKESVEVLDDGTLKRDGLGNVIVKPILGNNAGNSGYVIAEGNKILVPFMSKEDHKSYGAALNTWRSGAANRPEYTNNVGKSKSDNNTPPPPVADATGLAGQLPSSPSSDINTNINMQVQERQQAASARAKQASQQGGFIALRQQGNTLGREATTMAPTPYISGTQDTPIPTNVKATTVAVPTPLNTPTPVPVDTSKPALPEAAVPPAKPLTTADYENTLARVTNSDKVIINVDTNLKSHSPADFKKIVDMPAFKDKSALVKGAGLIESGGNPLAVSKNKKTGKVIAVGVMQFTEDAAVDTGLIVKDKDGKIVTDNRLDPEASVEAGIQHFETQYQNVERALSNELGPVGMIKVDPRIVLSAYNGGFDSIRKAIGAGNTSYADIKKYIEKMGLKSPANMKENFEYAEKVITASIPFIVGGNASDESYIQTLKNFSIIDTLNYRPRT